MRLTVSFLSIRSVTRREVFEYFLLYYTVHSTVGSTIIFSQSSIICLSTSLFTTVIMINIALTYTPVLVKHDPTVPEKELFHLRLKLPTYTRSFHRSSSTPGTGRVPGQEQPVFTLWVGGCPYLIPCVHSLRRPWSSFTVCVLVGGLLTGRARDRSFVSRGRVSKVRSLTLDINAL